MPDRVDEGESIIHQDKMKLRSYARQLRKQSTPLEVKVWQHLRSRRFQELKFRRQCPMGAYIVDFICFEKMLIIEIDGGQHNASKQQAYDNRRTEYLKKLGYRVLRFWNNDVLTHFDTVMDQIYYEVFLRACPQLTNI